MTNVCLPTHCGGPVYGASIPGPIWRDTMVEALRGVKASGFHRPPAHFFRKGSGEDHVRMPDLRGLKPDAAIARLRALHMDYRISSSEVHSRYPEGTVAETDPSPGASIDPGESGMTVVLTLSKGPERNHDDRPSPFDGDGPSFPELPFPRLPFGAPFLR